jgi:hypothetical protein
MPQEAEDLTCIRDGHKTKKDDCDIHNKSRIKDRWKREVSRVRSEL